MKNKNKKPLAKKEFPKKVKGQRFAIPKKAPAEASTKAKKK